MPKIIPVTFNEWSGYIVENKYTANDRIALQMWNDDEGPIAHITVNVPELDGMPEDYIAIKNYSEGEGMLEQLIEQKIVEDTGIRVHSGFVEIPIVKYVHFT